MTKRKLIKMWKNNRFRVVLVVVDIFMLIAIIILEIAR